MPVTLFEHRRDQFRQLYNYFTDQSRDADVPTADSRIRRAEHEDDFVFLAKLRVIPARNPNYSLDKLSDTWDYHTDYRLQLFIDTLEHAVIDNDYTEDDVHDELAAIEDRVDSHPNRDYPQDGSQGQAKVALTAKRDAYRWLIGEFHGYDFHDTDYY